MGLRLLRWRGKPLVALQRAANPRYGRSTAELEILASDVDTTTAFIDELRRRMNALQTLTVRYLLHELPEATTVLLQGGSLGLVAEAARLARALAPAIVVLEDVDLVAAERGTFGLQPMLFEVLDALDGIDGDADVAFVLTTNRADVLEPPLAARPGRIDLAEIPLPDAAARRELFALYAA